MPTPTWAPAFAITASGKEVSFPILFYCIADLYRDGYMSYDEWHEAYFWIDQYRNGLAMPGGTRFRSAYSGEMVYFPHFLDDLHEMFLLASNWYDLTDDEDALDAITENPEDDDVDLWTPWPHNIGHFSINPGNYSI